jgi:hypothetical protein
MRPTFPYSKLSSSSNFSSLQELAIDAKFISMEFLSSFNILGSLSQLQLSGDFGRTNRCEVGLVGAVGRVVSTAAAGDPDCVADAGMSSSSRNASTMLTMFLVGPAPTYASFDYANGFCRP